MSDFFISSPVRRSIDSRAATEQGSADWSIGGAECYNPCWVGGSEEDQPRDNAEVGSFVPGSVVFFVF